MNYEQGCGCVILEAVNSDKGDNEYSDSDVIKLQHSYPLKIIIPQHASESQCKWIYPVTFGGGLVGGDQINLEVIIGHNCCGLVTSTESLRIYECDDKVTSRQVVEYTVGTNSLLCVIADPVVCFQRSSFIQEQVIKMSAQSNLVFLDWVVGGRVSLNELWTFHNYSTKFSVYIDDKLVLKESNQLKDTPFQRVAESLACFPVVGFGIVLGQHLQHLIMHLQQLFGKPYKIGEMVSTETICTFSPLSYTVNSNKISGCYIRFVTGSTNQAYNLAKQMFQPLSDVLGGEIFNR